MKFKSILLMGMPRSGTSWLSQIFDSHPSVRFKLSPLFSYRFKNIVGKESTQKEWIDFLHKVYNTEDEFMDQAYRRRAGEYPIFENKDENPRFLAIKDTRYHNLARKMLQIIPDVKIIYIVRNPCGAIYSWLTAPKEFPKGADPWKEWRSGACRKTAPEEFWGFDDWKVVTSIYMKLQEEYSRQIRIIQYEDLVDDVERITKELFKFIGLKIKKQTYKFLIESQSFYHPNEYAVYKDPGVKHKWKKGLDKKIVEKIYKELKDTKFERFLK